MQLANMEYVLAIEDAIVIEFVPLYLDKGQKGSTARDLPRGVCSELWARKSGQVTQIQFSTEQKTVGKRNMIPR